MTAQNGLTDKWDNDNPHNEGRVVKLQLLLALNITFIFTNNTEQSALKSIAFEN